MIIANQRIKNPLLLRARELRRNMTAAELELWHRLRGNQLHNLHFRRQQIIHGFIVDFYCHAARLVLEVDGDVHDQQAQRDWERTASLQRHGLAVMRVRNEDVLQDVDGVLKRLAWNCRLRIEAQSWSGFRSRPSLSDVTPPDDAPEAAPRQSGPPPASTPADRDTH